MKYAKILTLVLSLILSSYVFSHSHGHDSSLSIDHPWARASAPGAPSAGFLTIHNGTDKDEVLLDVDGDFARKLELHKSSMENGLMKMQHQTEGVVIPAGTSVEFKPGSYHLMFMGLRKNFEKGEVYTVVLTFKNAGQIAIDLPVMESKGTSAMSH